LDRLWREPEVSGVWDELDLRGVVMLPPPASHPRPQGLIGGYVARALGGGGGGMRPPRATHPRPQVLIGGYVDRVLRRVATMGDGWLTYFYTAQRLRSGLARIPRHARGGGRGPA